MIRRAKSQERRSELEAELAGPPVGNSGLYLWNWFLQLRSRSGGTMGIEPITWEAVRAWAWATRLRPAPWEIEVVMAIDDAWVRARDEKPPADN